MNIKALEQDFTRRGIDFSKPGFFDHPKFVAVEQAEPSFLERYADYVHQRPYSSSYIDHARHVIQRAAKHLHAELKADGRKGACIDASMVLSRILDHEGIWNCIVAGATRVSFQKEVGIPPRHFCPIMHESNNAKTGHAWLHAPPFRVVDVTIDLQPYANGEERFLSGPILDESPTTGTYDVEDLVDSQARASFFGAYRRQVTLDDTYELVRDLDKRISRYGCFVTSLPKAKITYVACRIGAPDLPLDQMRNLILRGKPPHVVYDEFKRAIAP